MRKPIIECLLKLRKKFVGTKQLCYPRETQQGGGLMPWGTPSSIYCVAAMGHSVTNMTILSPSQKVAKLLCPTAKSFKPQ